jgi:predicted RNA binding protein YcfA (HicA-like mRNA interferase family)
VFLLTVVLKADVWYLLVTGGSHRQFKHLKKVGRVTVAGKPNDDFPRHLE